MKKINIFLCILLSSLMMLSCKSSQTITVHAAPGTKIYTPADIQNPVGSVSNSGKLKVKLSVKPYFGYLLAEAPQSSLKVPFGLDYKHTKYELNMLTGTLCTTLGCCLITTGIISSSDTPSTGIGLAAGGALLTAAGIKSWCSLPRDGWQAYSGFAYEKNQNAIQDLPLSSSLERNDPPRPAAETGRPEKILRSKAVSGASATATSVQKASKAKKSRTDFGAAVAGDYTGSGMLKSARTTVESYGNILVSIVRINASTVRVRVIENGEEFFESPMDYTVKRQKNGSYLLTLPDIPSAKITLTPDHKLIYIHDKVNIDSEIYTLSITARKILAK